MSEAVLYRFDDGQVVRTVTASIQEHGSLRVYRQDIGEVLERDWGDADYERWITIPAEHKDAVLLLLLEERFKGRADAVDELRALLEARGISCELMAWT